MLLLLIYFYTVLFVQWIMFYLSEDNPLMVAFSLKQIFKNMIWLRHLFSEVYIDPCTEKCNGYNHAMLYYSRPNVADVGPTVIQHCGWLRDPLQCVKWLQSTIVITPSATPPHLVGGYRRRHAPWPSCLVRYHPLEQVFIRISHILLIARHRDKISNAEHDSGKYMFHDVNNYYADIIIMMNYVLYDVPRLWWKRLSNQCSNLKKVWWIMFFRCA